MRRGIITLGLATGLTVSLSACGAGASTSPSATTAAASAAASGPTIEVTGKDYAFEGLPTEVAAGTQLTFKNVATDEEHLLVVVRKNDNATRELEAAPGQSASGTITLDKPGEYLALCPIPVGSMAGPASDAMPHFMKGMYQVFTVK